MLCAYAHGSLQHHLLTLMKPLFPPYSNKTLFPRKACWIHGISFQLTQVALISKHTNNSSTVYCNVMFIISSHCYLTIISAYMARVLVVHSTGVIIRSNIWKCLCIWISWCCTSVAASFQLQHITYHTLTWNETTSLLQMHQHGSVLNYYSNTSSSISKVEGNSASIIWATDHLWWCCNIQTQAWSRDCNSPASLSSRCDG